MTLRSLKLEQFVEGWVIAVLCEWSLSTQDMNCHLMVPAENTPCEQNSGQHLAHTGLCLFCGRNSGCDTATVQEVP